MSQDSDNEGIQDHLDNCPSTANPNQLDNRYDGYGDVSDDDDDGMPDEWEEDFGLNSLDDTGINGSDGDLDGNNWTNIQEYQKRTLPNDAASHPARPLPWLMLLLED